MNEGVNRDCEYLRIAGSAGPGYWHSTTDSGVPGLTDGHPIYTEACINNVRQKYRKPRVANGHDRSKDVQVRSDSPPPGTPPGTSERYHRRMCVPSSLSSSAPGSSMIGLGGRWWYWWVKPEVAPRSSTIGEFRISSREGMGKLRYGQHQAPRKGN